MILLAGIPTESPLAMVADALRETHAHFFILNQRRAGEMRIEFTLSSGTVTGWLECGNELYRLEDFEGVYLRLMDDRSLPELSAEPEDSPLRAHVKGLHEALHGWVEVAETRVVNPPSAMSSNASKPFQSQLIRQHGLCLPETLITNEPDLVREFLNRHSRVIYKSISGVRSIVQLVEKKDLDRIHKIRWCPTQFQEYIEGDNVRVHVVGEQVFATRVCSCAVDYRYAQTQVGTPAELAACELPGEIVERCVALAGALRLPFAGIDLKIATTGQVYCFEVNPCPGYSYYQAHTGQPIAAAVAQYLCGKRAGPELVGAATPAPGSG